MNENYLITIVGSILTEDDTDTVSLTTVGSFYQKGEKYYICYKDSSATGFEGCTTTLKVWNSGVSMTRFGPVANSNLIIEQGSVNICNYETDVGVIALDINGIAIDSRLTPEGGDLTFEYSLNSGGMLISDNKVCVNVKEII
ncbi:MAG: DUF1934 domain-containing protein [Oscillospiraceae bacterium]